MWWDERFAAFEGAVTEVDEQSRTAAGTHLSATIALESAYVRTLVQEAFDRRPEWAIPRTESSDEASSNPIHDESLFYWGEYEGIDWEQVHSAQANSMHAAIASARA